MYKSLNDMEVHDLEVMWIKIMPKKTPRKFSCIQVACLYYTPKTEYLKILMRKHPECGCDHNWRFQPVAG
ncbi:hypothetical protein NP493_595g01024 [Ridgeia piscesae]|uniref:Uncharacterized protein n=1 Tax=Ridgeia piscesae TaxID=27915 RepID=A0AAD9KVF6_RIDPI|nr:hypothetical protein NP493_595g01024 [Ridgeia piscesae]